MHTGAIVWENTTEPNADASFAPSMAIPGVVFEGKDVGGVLRAYAADTGTLLGQFPVSFTLPSAPAVVDGLVILGGGSGERGGDADSVSRIPQPVTALCVPGTPACDGRAPRGVRRHGFSQPSRCPRGPQPPGRQR
jgi:hypothetical protein